MSKYDALTEFLKTKSEPDVVLTFDELEGIIGGLPSSARKYSAWWANKKSNQAHSSGWLDAGRTVRPDFKTRTAVFSLMSEDTEKLLRGEEADSPEQVDLQESYIESSISLERDLERHLIQHLEQLEPGLQLLGQQVSIEGGRIDILAQSAAGEKVVIELKVGEAKDAAIGQIARYIGWYQQTEGNRPRAILVAAGFPEPIRYAAKAIAGLQLLEYKVFFAFEDAGLK